MQKWTFLGPPALFLKMYRGKYPCTFFAILIFKLWPNRLFFRNETLYACSSSITTSHKKAGFLIFNLTN